MLDLGGLEQVAHFDIDMKASTSGRLKSDPREHPVYYAISAGSGDLVFRELAATWEYMAMIHNHLYEYLM